MKKKVWWTAAQLYGGKPMWVQDDGDWSPLYDDMAMSTAQAAKWCQQQLAAMSARDENGEYIVTAVKAVTHGMEVRATRTA